MTNNYKIHEICGDWALDMRFAGALAVTLYFNSRSNAELVKAIMEHEDAHPNVAVPYKLQQQRNQKPCKKCSIEINVKYWRKSFMGYNFCPYCGRPLKEDTNK